MQRQKQVTNQSQELGKSTPGAQKATDQPKKTRTKPIESIGIETKLSLPTIFLLLIQVSLGSRPPKKTNATKETIEKITALLEPLLPRLQKNIMIRPNFWAISNTISANRKVIINKCPEKPKNLWRSRRPSHQWLQKTRGRIKISTLY